MRTAAPCLMFSCPLVSISVSYLLEGGAVIVKVDVGVFNCVQNMYLNERIIFVGQNNFHEKLKLNIFHLSQTPKIQFTKVVK